MSGGTLLPEIGIVDTAIGFPRPSMKDAYAYITRQANDAESKESFEFPVEYMFKDVPEKSLAGSDDPVHATLSEMDRWGVEIGVVRVGDPAGIGAVALEKHPERFIGTWRAEPGRGARTTQDIVRAFETHGIRAVDYFPSASEGQVAINDKLMYPVYAKCVELGLPIFCCTGVPGPRLPYAPQSVELIDEVMYDFPDLTFVTRHGCEPWTELAVKLMLKWPGLYYSTSAFAPKYYPKNVIEYANTRGADKIIYGGYFPFALSLERIMTEMPGVPLKDEVWPKFLRHNALRVLGVEA